MYCFIICKMCRSNFCENLKSWLYQIRSMVINSYTYLPSSTICIYIVTVTFSAMMYWDITKVWYWSLIIVWLFTEKSDSFGINFKMLIVFVLGKGERSWQSQYLKGITFLLPLNQIWRKLRKRSKLIYNTFIKKYLGF